MPTNAEYELLEEVGRGPTATVYRAHDMALKRDVAVKELLPQLRTDPRSIRRLLDGARFLAGLGHDNVVPVYGLDEGRGWIIMELMRGGLDSRLAEGPLTPDLTRSVLRQALSGLQFLHKQGKLHGAIKPSNLLINAEGRVKLSDAAGLDGQGEVRKPGDNAKYLAPELINPTFGSVGPASDLYCLGLTALELLKGPGFDAVFQGAGAADPQMSWLRLHGSPQEQIPSVRELVPGAPADLVRVIDRLLAKKVSERYASAADALQDLEEGELLPVNVPAAAPPAARAPRPTTHVTPVAGLPAPVRPAPPPPPAPSHKTAPVSKPTPAPSGLKPWSKDWINHKLSEPRILYSVLGVIIVGTLVFFFWPEEDETSVGKVLIKTDPPGATIIIDGKKRKKKTDDEVKLPPGKHKLRLELDDYASREEEIVVEADGKVHEFNYPLRKEVAQANQTPAKTEPSPSPTPDGSKTEKQDKPPAQDKPPPPPADRLTNSMDMQLVRIQDGRFMMGTSRSEQEREANEEPQHEVTITKPFYMGTHEVTQEQYEKVMGENPAFFNQANGGGPRHPVENASWDNAVEFCRRLSERDEEKKAGRRYRLPTEAEWEYACRAGTSTPYRGGNGLNAKDACFQGSAPGGNGDPGEDAERTMPVGKFAPNAWGLYDMHGNVREWCSDQYSSSYYAESPQRDPQGPVPVRGEEKVVRGGSWQSPGSECRCARRMKFAPDLLNVGTGFRVVMEQSEVK